jgi:hypothetical protein
MDRSKLALRSPPPVELVLVEPPLLKLVQELEPVELELVKLELELAAESKPVAVPSAAASTRSKTDKSKHPLFTDARYLGA